MRKNGYLGDHVKVVTKEQIGFTEKYEKVTYELVKIDKKKAVMLITDPRNTFTLIYDTPWVRENFIKNGRLTRYALRRLVYDAEMAYSNMKYTGVGRAYGEEFKVPAK
jgi:hypothetical protein